MKPRFFFPSLGLVAVLLAACAAPQATQSPAPQQADLPQTATQAPENISPPQATSEAPIVIAVPTSRGPNLEATDPATVSLASGQLQLIEFFRFT
jgi:hypothetical protein